jgi:hypothetical protein
MNCFKYSPYLEIYQGASVIFGISFIIWLGFYFGLVKPEITKKHTYIEEVCQIIDLNIISKYHCTTNYVSCYSDAYRYQKCNSLESLYSHLDPNKCSIDPTQCAPIESPCDRGYECCRTCCQTCQSCTTDSKGKKTCSNYSCNCYCCVNTYHSEGVVKCDIHYTDVVTLKISEILVNTTITKNFQTDIVKANEYINSYSIGQEMQCWYDPKNYQNVVFNIEYSTWKFSLMWVTVSIMALCIFIIFGFLFKEHYETIKRYICCHIREINPPLYDNGTN